MARIFYIKTRANYVWKTVCYCSKYNEDDLKSRTYICILTVCIHCMFSLPTQSEIHTSDHKYDKTEKISTYKNGKKINPNKKAKRKCDELSYVLTINKNP